MTEAKRKRVEGLNHVAIVVPDLSAASALYRDTFGCAVSDPIDIPAQGIVMVRVELGGTHLELMTPSTPNSPIARFLERNPAGGLHHICFNVEDVASMSEHVKSHGISTLGTGETTTGYHGKPIVFLHPKDVLGTLIELEAMEPE
jgi:methylmalonyl-CoA/ethylmalonyl-CoA epimerase